MEYFLESSHLDSATADMLRKYDRDGNGSFSKDEVVAIILDLREAMQSNEMLGASNKMLRRVVVAVLSVCFFMLAATFGLTYAVVALTAKMDINSNGVMTTTDGKTVVATDSTGYRISPLMDEETGAFCISGFDAVSLVDQTTSGRTNVIVQFDGINGTQTSIQGISGGVVDIDNETGKTCFTGPQGNQVCMEKTDDCLPKQMRRARQRQRGLNLNLEDTERTLQDLDDTEERNLQECTWTTILSDMSWVAANANCINQCNSVLSCVCTSCVEAYTVSKGG
jgi:hypothetical protein